MGDIKIFNQPYNFQIELTEGCTRRCDFCGINQIKHKIKPPNFMSLELAEIIAIQINRDFKKNIRVEFAVHGEPLMHPNVTEIIKIFRSYLPKAQLSIISNGDLIVKNNLLPKELFDAGLNYLMVDLYEKNEGRIDKIFEAINIEGVDVKSLYDDNINIWSYKGFKHKCIVVVDNLGELSGKKIIRKVHTAGGNLPEDAYEKYKIDRATLPKLTRCAKPFRELTINYNGNISICCEDWKQVQSVGNIIEEDIIDIWDSDKMNQYRYLLYNKRRDLIPLCSKCNEVSFRVGFLKVNKEYPKLIKQLENGK